MKLLLRESIDRLGRRGEVVDVARGYAQNYLLPKGLGVMVTNTNVKLIEQEKRQIVARELERVDELKDLKAQIEKVSCTIEVRANEEGHLYGSVSVRDIVEAYKVEGIELEERSIRLEKPIKETGVANFPIALHPDVTVDGKVWVIAEKGSAEDADDDD